MSKYELTREFLLQRGKCCHLNCKNCPWKETKDDVRKEQKETKH